ncbi:MAG: hypothetical protein DRN08_04770 [Thermoplasmata archaeon]|nr:MAG: hypothetical protein DRN08_04770 [Thermoplasmata archaeon]
MIAKNPLQFQTFFISREKSNCPLIPDIIRFIEKLDKHRLCRKKIDNTGSISIRYGRRMLINCSSISLSDIKQEEDFLEIADYDPLKNIVLAIGVKEPHINTPLHWFVHRAREDINAIAILNSKNIAYEQTMQNLPAVSERKIPEIIEPIKEVLKMLRNRKNIPIKNNGVMFTGFDLNEIEEMVFRKK